MNQSQQCRPWLAGACAVAVVTAVVVLRLRSISDVVGPVVFFDEFIYWSNMGTLAQGVGKLNPGYPPLYSAAMLLGRLWSDPYRGVLVVNVLLGLPVLLAAWSLARDRGLVHRLFAIALLGVLPTYWIYPRMMMSENLFVPLVAAVLFGLHHAVERRSVIWLLLTGVALWMACMTRYQGVFVTAAAAMSLLATGAVAALSGATRPWRAMGAAVAAAAVVGGLPWVGILLWQHAGWPASWEMRKMAQFMYRQDIQLTVRSVSVWTAAYASYVVLCVLPALPALLHGGWGMLTRPRGRPLSELIALLFTLLAAGTSAAVAIRHSALQGYNQPIPSHVNGRYLIFLPSLAWLSLLATRYLQTPFDARGRRQYLAWWLLSLVLAVLAYGCIVRGWFFQIQPWFIMGHSATGAYAYTVSVVVLTGALAVGLLPILSNRALFLVAGVVFMAGSAWVTRMGFFNNADGPEAFVAEVRAALARHPLGLVGTSSQSWFSGGHAEAYLRFRGANLSRVVFDDPTDPDVVAVVGTDAPANPDHKPLYVASDGLAVYLQEKVEEALGIPMAAGVSADLISAFRTQDLGFLETADNPWGAEVATITDPAWGRCLVTAVSNTKLQFPMLRLPRGCRNILELGLVIHPDARNVGSPDGVSAEVSVTVDGTEALLFSQRIGPTDPCRRLILPLPEGAREVNFTFRTHDDPKRGRGDWLLWIEPRIRTTPLPPAH